MTNCNSKRLSRWTVKDRTFLVEHRNWPALKLAEALGRTVAAVLMMKCRLLTTRRISLPEQLALFERLHAQGFSDRDIAYRMGINAKTAWRYRQQLGLPANRWTSSMRGRQSERLKQTKRRLRIAEAKRKQRDRYTSKVHPAYTPEESEFLRAVSAFRGQHGRPPSLLEGFALAKKLGWTKGEVQP